MIVFQKEIDKGSAISDILDDGIEVAGISKVVQTRTYLKAFLPFLRNFILLLFCW
jgi:hypothetical protein